MNPTHPTVDKARWNILYDFIVTCGKARNPRDFAVAIVENINDLCAYDQALVYFYDANGKVCGQHLVNINETWSTMFLEHYTYTDNQRYSCYSEVSEHNYKGIETFITWDEELSTDFVPNYIRPRGLRYSYGFVLFDVYGKCRTMICLDRTRDQAFSKEEMENLQLSIPLLNNLHRNFYFQSSSFNDVKQIMWDSAKLTEREAEVANLLCQAVSPTNISKTLHIARATTYKHISHIYEKLNVSNKQELLVRLLRSKV